jgi:acyl-CoA oxidase
MVSSFNKVLADVRDQNILRVLAQLGAFFACSLIMDDQVWTGLINHSQMNLVKQAIAELLDALRPNAVALVDAFDIPDNVLMSTIGRFDGNVYESLYETALKAPLNQSDPFDGYKEYLQPHLDLEFLKKGNKVPTGSAAPARL